MQKKLEMNEMRRDVIKILCEMNEGKKRVRKKAVTTIKI